MQKAQRNLSCHFRCFDAILFENLLPLMIRRIRNGADGEKGHLIDITHMGNARCFHICRQRRICRLNCGTRRSFHKLFSAYKRSKSNRLLSRK